MTIQRFLPDGRVEEHATLAPVMAALEAERPAQAARPADTILDILDDFGRRIVTDERTRHLEGVAFLGAWLRRGNLERMLRLNLGRDWTCLDGFTEREGIQLGAVPRGIVAMWMAGNIPTLPLFSIVPALLAKNCCAVKLALPDPAGMDVLLRVLAESGDGGTGRDLTRAVALCHFDWRAGEHTEALSMAADVRVVWGGAEAVRAITSQPRREHCTDLVFGPKYSIGLLGAALMEDERAVDKAVAGFVRDVAAFDQRACSAPQTIFFEANPHVGLEALGARFAAPLRRLPPKPGLDAYTTSRILATRAEYALDEARAVLVSGPEANWTVCMDRETTLKEAVQSRTIFLTELPEWRMLLPLLSPRIQTVGLAMGDPDAARRFAWEAARRGVARCVRPGLMNAHESPWDGHLTVSELVRWVSLKE